MIKNVIRTLRYFDWVSFALTCGLVLLGACFILSATYTPEVHYSLYFKKQVLGIGIGLCIYFFCTFFDHHKLLQGAYVTFYIIVFLLAYTLVAGFIGMGGRRWVSFYLFSFQPAELIKITLPAFLIMHGMKLEPSLKYKTMILPFKNALFALFMLALNFILIVKQPDLGTALVIFLSGLVMLWLCGLSRVFYISLFLLGGASAPILWHKLHPYQKQRVLVFLGQGSEKKERYHIEQSKIAIGSGGLAGKGFMKGTQNTLSFLPEDHTDFIFSVICEEWGFLGALLVITLLMLLFGRICFLLASLENIRLQILGIGLLLPIILSSAINIGMVMGALPIVGIPLPLISYGVTNLWITFASLGWIHNITIQRFKY
jgi:rod shape determining protein RodA